MIVKLSSGSNTKSSTFESSVNSYDSQTVFLLRCSMLPFESSVNSYDSQTTRLNSCFFNRFESSVNSYDSQTCDGAFAMQ